MLLLRVRDSSLRCVRLLKVGPRVIQTATIMGRGTRGGPLSLPKPFPYKEKPFRWYNNLMDNTMFKMSQENCKVIVVEGPIGVGKSAFCKALAEEFDMFYMPQPTMDEFYLLPSGYDLRQHDNEVPERVRTYDHKNFCRNPTDIRAAEFQVNMMKLRFLQYVDAICHMLNTGQGVVMERSYFSDYVFMKAMQENKYLSKAVADAYLTMKLNTSTLLMPPHLVIYLDIPVPVVEERIRTRNYSYEQDSPALTKEYLSSLEKYWKQDYLKKARQASDILIYDWTDGGDIEVVIDDIEKMNFDIMRSDAKFVKWWLSRGALYRMRALTTNSHLSYYMPFFAYPVHRIDELFVRANDSMAWNKILLSLPECEFDVGYNYHMGDSIFNILFRTTVRNHRSPKYHLSYYGFPHDRE